MVYVGVAIVVPGLWLLRDLPMLNAIGYMLRWWAEPHRFYIERMEKNKKEEPDQLLSQKISQQRREAQEGDRAYREAYRHGKVDDDKVRMAHIGVDISQTTDISFSFGIWLSQRGNSHRFITTPSRYKP